MSGYFCVLPDELIVYIICFLHPGSVPHIPLIYKIFIDIV